MISTIRVASTEELPPGKGKVVQVGERQITVFNRDGRFYASSSHAPRRAPAFDTSCTHSSHGMSFDVYSQDSPARMHDDERCHLRIDDEGIWLIVD